MSKRGDEPRVVPTEPALRVLMRRLRDIMAEPGDGQTRLDRIVKLIAGVMVAEVCSIYLKRQDGSLELFATEGLNPLAVHSTRMKRGEGLVGRCAELKEPVNEADAPNHPAFSYRPETGEEVYHSLLAVPILRSGEVLGVLVIQNRKPREYSDEDVELLQATAMVVAEHLVSGAVAGSGAAIEISKTLSHVIAGEPISEGIALGHAHLHEPRIVVTKLMAEDPEIEVHRLAAALLALKSSLDEMLAHEHLSGAGEHRDVLEAYRMFAHDKGWERRLREAVESGLTAEAAVERVQNSTRARMLRQHDAYWRERQRDLDDLSDRLQRILAGKSSSMSNHSDMPPDTVLIARNMGPAELLDYDRTRLRGVVVEDGSGQSHVAIVAKALGLAAIGQAAGVIERVNAGDAVIVDAEAGEVHLRPSAEVINAYSDKVRFRARRRQRFDSLRDTPAVTKDGAKIALHINAGLVVDIPHLCESGADGVGLFRTELQFMLSHTFPRLSRQVQTYSQVLAEAGDKPVVFRALDIGGDKVLPYLKQPQEENPALGWRAIRMSLDRPALFRTQLRAFLMAGAERDLKIMVPMVTRATEMDAVHELLAKERALLAARGHKAPRSIAVGAMLEVPSLLFELDALMRRADFISVGSNDLAQFLYAADRTNPLVAKRFDPLSVPLLLALRTVVKAAARRRVPLTLCGELAGSTLTAMALIGLGFRSISMAPASIGPVKSMILSLDAGRIAGFLDDLLKKGHRDVRGELQRFAEADSIEL
jgi:phosphotransferase system enzyme I (PtsP)